MEFSIKILVIFIIVFCFVLYVMPQYSFGYMAGFIDKLERAKAIAEPKILLMGDSNVAYGIDSKLLEEAMNMPVVNMGLHGGLGQTFCMDLAKPEIKQRDIVVILPAYYGYDSRLLDGTLAWLILENDLSLLKRVKIYDYTTLIMGYPAYLKKAINLWKSNMGNTTSDWEVNRKDLNEYGDVSSVGNDNVMPGGYLESETFSMYSNVNNDLMEYYNEYNQYVLSQGAVMVLTCPPIIEPLWDGQSDAAEKRQQEVIQALEFPVISDWKDYIYPEGYFYNTNNHLNDIGKVIRTE